MGKRAFTLVELLVVIGIIGVLAGIILPQIINSRKPAMIARAKSNLRNVYIAFQQYAGDHNGRMPWAGPNKKPWQHLQVLVDEGYVDSSELFADEYLMERPADMDINNHFTLTPETCSYTYLNQPLAFGQKPSNRIIMATKSIDPGYEDGIVILRMNASTDFFKFKKGEKKQLPQGLYDTISGRNEAEPTAADKENFESNPSGW